MDMDTEEHVHNDDWTPAGGMLLGDEDEHQGRSWTSMTDDVEDMMSKPIFAPGDQFGEGLLFQGDVIVPAIGRAHGHDIDHPLRRGGSEIGMTRRNGPVGMGATDGRERRKTVYEIVKAAGEGSFAQVYHIREKGGKRRDYGEFDSLAEVSGIVMRTPRRALTPSSPQNCRSTRAERGSIRKSVVRGSDPPLSTYSYQHRHPS